MDLAVWKTQVAERLRASTQWLRDAAPGMAYGALATCSILPLVAAVKGGDWGTYGTLAQLVGDVGVSLIAGRVEQWHQGSLDEMTADLDEVAADSEEWRTVLDTILAELETPKLAQAVLSEADWDRLARLLARDVERLGSRIEGDWVSGDKVSGDKVAGDKIEGDNVGRDKYSFGDVQGGVHVYPPMDERPAEPLSVHYFQRLRTHCHALPLTAMGGEATAAEDVTLDKVYIDLDTTTRVRLTDTEKADLQKENPSRSVREDAERVVTAREAAQQTRRLVLLGHPGGGKSTFVRQLLAERAAAWAEVAENPQWQPGLFPLLTVLRDLTPRLQELALNGLTRSQQEERLVECLLAQWQTDLQRFHGADQAATLQQALLSGELLLVFDGLDEMPTETRTRVKMALVALTHAYPKIAQIIVTCRIRSYSGDTVLPGFQSYTLADFDQEQIKRFIIGWYNAQRHLGRLTPERAATQTADLQQAVTQRDLQRMAVNPMLLTTMAIIHQKETRLPDQRVQLYDRAVDVLLYRWQQDRASHVSPELATFLKNANKVRSLLERLAYAAHEPRTEKPTAKSNRKTRSTRTDESTDLTRREVIGLLDEALPGQIGLAAEFLDYVDLRAGLLVGRGGDGGRGGNEDQDAGEGINPALYAFAHRTFQEYLAGCWLLAGRESKRNFWKHTAADDYWQLAAQLGAEELLYNRRRDQELLDLMYHLCPVRQRRSKQALRATLWSGQMALLLDRGMIAADSFADGGNVYLDRLIKRLDTILTGTTLPAVERADAGRTLAKLGDPRDEVLTTPSMQFCYVPAGPFIMGSNPDEDEMAYEREQPQHELNIAYGYWIGRFPVTNAQFAEFIADGGYADSAYWEVAIAYGYWKAGAFKGEYDREPRTHPYQFGEPFHFANHPVVGITWYEALAYTRWLTANHVPAGWQACLPSEAEWEKAARGGVQIPRNPLVSSLAMLPAEERIAYTFMDNPQPTRRFPWGDQIDLEKCSYNETNLGSTTAVGAFSAGAGVYGTEEMSGSVYEWMRSVWGESAEPSFKYPYNPNDGREDLSLDNRKLRLMRGGAFDFDGSAARAACRRGDFPVNWSYLVGVRLVLSPFPRKSAPPSSGL